MSIDLKQELKGIYAEFLDIKDAWSISADSPAHLQERATSLWKRLDDYVSRLGQDISKSLQPIRNETFELRMQLAWYVSPELQPRG